MGDLVLAFFVFIAWLSLFVDNGHLKDRLDKILSKLEPTDE